jgi:UDP-3-O-[3-hydroxymyristoyl] glucosamine N-acyltransferase
MPDTRFYEDFGPIDLAELVQAAGATADAATLAGRRIRLAAPLDRAGPDAVSFFSDRRYVEGLKATKAGACFVVEQFASDLPDGCVALITSEPQAAYARAASRLHRPRRHEADVGAIHPTAEIAEGAVICPGAVIGGGARIGPGSRIGPNAVIGPGVVIGRDCVIGANAVIGFALIADRVRILAGAVIGEAGFGVAASREGAVDVPQLGRVVVEDDVSIGACTCVDRGAWEDTVIGQATKIDNLVQIAHNVRLGRSCLLAGHVGLSGSVTVGDGAIFGGRAGVADHLSIGAGAQVAAAAGVMHDIPAGERWAGAPAKPVRKFMRESAWLARMASAGKGGSEG